MTWKQVQRRNRVVRDIVDRVGDRLPPLSADDLRTIDSEFSDLEDFLLQVHALWSRALDARIDAVLESSTYDRRAAVGDVLDALARDLPGALRILDEYAGNPVLARVVDRHERMVFDATGVDIAGVAVTAPAEPARISACTVRRRLRAARVSLGVAR